MIAGIADTHAAIWYVYNDPRLSASVRRLFDDTGRTGDQIGLSSISLAEVVYLVEKGRVPPEAFGELTRLLDDPDSVLTEVHFDRSIASMMPHIDRALVPDMPDRIIATTALYLGVPVISRDGRIRSSGISTVW